MYILKIKYKEKETQKGKMKNPKVQKSKRCENVKSNNIIIIMPHILSLYFTSFAYLNFRFLNNSIIGFYIFSSFE